MAGHASVFLSSAPAHAAAVWVSGGYGVPQLVLCRNGTSHTLGMLKTAVSPLWGGGTPSCSPPAMAGQHCAAWLRAGKLDKTGHIKGSAACRCLSCQAMSVSLSVPCPSLAHVGQGSGEGLHLSAVATFEKEGCWGLPG